MPRGVLSTSRNLAAVFAVLAALFVMPLVIGGCGTGSRPADGGADATFALDAKSRPDGEHADAAHTTDGSPVDYGPCPVINTTIPTLPWPPANELPSDWVVVTGAKGDGQADDTAFLQSALDKLGGQYSAARTTVFLPAGTYRITKTLTAASDSGIDGFELLGTGESTKIVWGGSPSDGGGESGVMLHSNGTGRSLFQGIVWDGNGVAGIGIDHNPAKIYETAVRHYDERFQNFTVAGIRTTDETLPTAEVFLKNIVFMNVKNATCGQANGTCGSAILLAAANDYDNKILGCAFVDNDIGINSEHGNFNVSSSNFVRSGVDDVQMNAHSFRMQSVVSNCSTQTAWNFQSNNGSTFLMNDTHVSGWTSDAGALSLGNSGPFVLFDNVFAAGPDGGGAPIKLHHDGITNPGGGHSPQQVLSSNNTVDHGAVFDPGVSGVIDEVPLEGPPPRTPVGKDTWFQSTKPSLPIPTQFIDASKNGVSVSSNDDQSDAMQRVIDLAKAAGHGAVAYFPPGGYHVSKPLEITGSDYGVAGAGYWTWLFWSGGVADAGESSSILWVHDPENVTVSNFLFLYFDAPTGLQASVAGLRQTSTSATDASVFYEALYFPVSDSARGLELKDLPSGTTVHAGELVGTVNVLDSAAANVYIDVWESGVTRVAGAKNPRTGYLEVGARYNAAHHYDYVIEDNQSITVSQSYTEQTDAGLYATGSDAAPPGQIVIGMAKFQFDNPQPVLLSGYQGLVALGAGFFSPENSGTDAGFTFTQTGGASTLFFFGASFWNPSTYETGAGNSVLSLASHDLRNGGVPIPLTPDDTNRAGYDAATKTLNALRSVRAHELLLDFGLK